MVLCDWASLLYMALIKLLCFIRQGVLQLQKSHFNGIGDEEREGIIGWDQCVVQGCFSINSRRHFVRNNYNHKVESSMIRATRPSHKKIASPRPSSHSPPIRNKNHESKKLNSTVKKRNDSCSLARQAHPKMKPASLSTRKKIAPHGITKGTNHKTKIQSRSPSKTSKKTKKHSIRQQNKNECREIQRQRLMQQYLKSKIVLNQKDREICNQSTQFFQNFTYSVQKQENGNYVSQFLSSDRSYIDEDVPSQFSTPCSSKNPQEESVNLKQSRIISIEQWQNYETLKLKNEELINYIEELQKVQKKLLEQNQQRQRQLKGQALKEREKIMQEYAQLNQKHTKVSKDNAALQQMFNQCQFAIQALKHENVSLTETATTSKEQAQKLSEDNQRLQAYSNQMRNQATKLKQALQSLHTEKQEMEKRYQSVCLQKERIKNQAEQMLKLVKKMQGKHQE